jgi:hypothetical protein
VRPKTGIKVKEIKQVGKKFPSEAKNTPYNRIRQTSGKKYSQ